MSQSNAHRNFNVGPLKHFENYGVFSPVFNHFKLFGSVLPSGMVTVKIVYFSSVKIVYHQLVYFSKIVYFSRSYTVNLYHSIVGLGFGYL